MSIGDWQDRRRAKLSREREKLLENAEKVEVTEENIPTLAKKTGRSEAELTKFLSQARAEGRTCSVRIPNQ